MISVFKIVRVAVVSLCMGVGFSYAAIGAEAGAEGIEFFERRIRPVLAQDCYECHRAGVAEKGGLVLDHREALLKGGRSGKVVVPGDPDGSRLIQAIRHTSEELKMPKSGAKLEPAVIADFEKWVRMGAPDPRDRPAEDAEVAGDNRWTAVAERRASWWSLRPIAKPDLPIQGQGGSSHPVDQFIRARLEKAGLVQAERADDRTLLRRLSYALRGVPPTLSELDSFLKDRAEGNYERIVDEFLASPRFGERWARHWMDWVRYADSHGSEGDPEIPYSWRYRDYLIRALNQDVPFDQLLREHLAGDLLSKPRINEELGLNESALGIGHFRMLQHGFSPTDPLEERVRNVDDQIDVISKAFLGLTVSCARCHNHKFDAISQEDFYALYGVLASTTPATIGVSVLPAEERDQRTKLLSLKTEIKARIAEAWIERSAQLAAGLLNPGAKIKEVIEKAKDSKSVLHLFYLTQNASGNAKEAFVEWEKKIRVGNDAVGQAVKRWELRTTRDFEQWRANGMSGPVPAGTFTIAGEGDRALEALYPSGAYSHLVSTKDRAVIVSPRFMLDRGYDLWLRVAGDGGAIARYAVQNYPRDGTVYPVTRLTGGEWRWVKHGLDYWMNDRIHIELSTAADQPVVADKNAVRSWFGITEAVIKQKGEAAPEEPISFNEPLLQEFHQSPPETVENLAEGYASALRTCATAWALDKINDGQAHFLDQLLGLKLVENSLEKLGEVERLVGEYRSIESSLREPIRAPGLIETGSEDQPLLVRGNHKQPGQPVRRRFLEVFGSAPYHTSQSGRLELAEDFLRPSNPLTTRVMVNRVWHHLFGQGIVATPDNFGRLGELPSHPELLDYLAGWFVENGYSTKKLIRFLVTSETWAASSRVPPGAEQQDPTNKLLAHANIRRLEGEAVRDALLSVSGVLDEKMYGPPVQGTVPRRSVYLRVKRNDLDPLVAVFDAPAPSSTKGRRDVTNVPGQSLTLLNDPLVISLATRWADRLERDPGTSNEVRRLNAMFTEALGRPPTPQESVSARRFLDDMTVDREKAVTERRRLETEIEERTRSLNALLNIAKSRASSGAQDAARDHSDALPAPIASWKFEKGMQDQVGMLHCKPFGNARIENGALVLDGKASYAATPALTVPLRAKTLEAWVQLDSLTQQGGGVMTVQDLRGETFDSIVFGEKRPGHWIAGSDFFKRTTDFEGLEENVVEEPVHIAIVYGADGIITAYRNGKPYGTPYKSRGPVQFEARDANILFGLRHGAPGGNRNLTGRIYAASLFDRALTAAEIEACARADGRFVPMERVLAELTEKERREYKAAEKERGDFEQQLRALEKSKGMTSEWANLAHALFNLKEFIYIR